MAKHRVDIPEAYLLHIATYGKMGTGEFSDLMKTWARKECERVGLAGKLKEMERERLKELRQGIRNVLGDDAMEYIDKGIKTATIAPHRALEGKELCTKQIQAMIYLGL